MPYNLAQLMRDVANSQYKGLDHVRFGYLWIKRDQQGYIINPDNMALKCGWGPCEKTAYMHFLERNGFD